MSIDFDVADGTAVIRLNRPHRANAIDPETAQQLADRVVEIERDDSIRCAIITGAGERHFCAGSDLKAKAADVPSSVTGYGFVDRPHSKPFIAAVNGIAAGGGFELALACDLVVAAEHASFLLPEVRHGVVAGGGGLIRLGRRLPAAIAREIVIAGRALSATEAGRWGLVNQVVPGGAVLACALEIAAVIARGAPIAVRESLAVLRLAAAEDAVDLWQRSRQASRIVLGSPDGREGPQAFAEGRAPVWTGRWSDCTSELPAFGHERDR